MSDERLSTASNDRLVDTTRLDASVAFYEKVITERIKGPQLEGFAPEYLRRALEDPHTKTIDVGDGIDWPLFAPVYHNQDYRAGFFDDHFAGRPAYYFSVPPRIDGVDSEVLRGVLEELKHENAVIAYDFFHATDDMDIEAQRVFFESLDMTVRDITPESEAYGMSYGLPNVVHFESLATASAREGGDGNVNTAFDRLVAAGKYEIMPTKGPTILSPDRLREDSGLLENIWNVYADQFNEVVDDHPALLIQPREELEGMLLDDDSFNIGYIEDGKIVALMYFVSNIEKCVWLNAQYYERLHETVGDSKMSYFPGIVVDKGKARQGAGYVDEMITLLEDVSYEAGITGLHITFECSNVSATYIPKIVTSVMTNHGITFDRPINDEGTAFTQFAEYTYKTVELS